MDTPTATAPQLTLSTLAASPAGQAAPRLTPTTRPFSDFGRYVEDVVVARPGTQWRLGDWIARNRRPGQLRGEVWRACRAANPHCFKTYAVISLARPSFFLPAGEVVFEATENPTQIPQSPPQGVMLRHLEAMDAHPDATFYYLEPVFSSEPAMRLYPADELRAEAAGDQQDAFMLARNYGALFRARAWAGEQRSRCGAALAAAAERVEDAILELSARLLPQPASLRRLEASHTAAVRMGQRHEAERLERAIRRIRWHMTFDPILCFELPGEAGRLRFEAHWYVGDDGKTYVHY